MPVLLHCWDVVRDFSSILLAHAGGLRKDGVMGGRGVADVEDSEIVEAINVVEGSIVCHRSMRSHTGIYTANLVTLVVFACQLLEVVLLGRACAKTR